MSMLVARTPLLRGIVASTRTGPRPLAVSDRSVRLFATKPQKKPEPKAVDEKAKDAKKKQNANWNVKGATEGRDKNTDFFVKLMLNQEKRYAAVKAVNRSKTRSLWEKQVARRYQQESSRQSNKLEFALHSAMRIRDAAIEALPTEALKREALAAGNGYKAVPLSRRAATWTPPLTKAS